MKHQKAEKLMKFQERKLILQIIDWELELRAYGSKAYEFVRKEVAKAGVFIVS